MVTILSRLQQWLGGGGLHFTVANEPWSCGEIVQLGLTTWRERGSWVQSALAAKTQVTQLTGPVCTGLTTCAFQIKWVVTHIFLLSSAGTFNQLAFKFSQTSLFTAYRMPWWHLNCWLDIIQKESELVCFSSPVSTLSWPILLCLMKTHVFITTEQQSFRDTKPHMVSELISTCMLHTFTGQESDSPCHHSLT